MSGSDVSDLISDPTWFLLYTSPGLGAYQDTSCQNHMMFYAHVVCVTTGVYQDTSCQNHMMFYAHVVCVTCYFRYMFSLGHSSGSSDSVRIYRRVIFGKQNW